MKWLLIKCLASYIVFVTVIEIHAQQWSDAVNISNMPERDMHAAMAVDADGVIHCVWTHFIESYYRKVYYSKTSDSGDTWSIPLDLSQNNDSTAHLPQMVISSLNEIYVVYHQDTEWTPGYTYLASKKNGYWKKQKIAGIDFYKLCKLGIDPADNIYLFMYYGSMIYYKYYNGLQWSQFLPTYGENTFISDVSFDQDNKLHFTGVKHIYNTNYRLIYGTFSPDSNIWSVPYEFDIDSVETPLIGLDQNDLPYIFYRTKFQINLNWSHPQHYLHFDGNEWTEPIQLSPDTYRQNFTFDDENQIHLFTTEAGDETTTLVYKRLENNIVTETSVVDWCDGPFSMGLPQPVLTNNNLCVSYIKPFGDFDCDVYFKKRELLTNTENKPQKDNTLIRCFPNPAFDRITIESKIPTIEPIEISILDAQGNLVHQTSVSPTNGLLNYQWNLKDRYNLGVNNGVYYINLKGNKFNAIKKCIVFISF